MAPVLINPSRFGAGAGGAYPAAVLADAPQVYWRLGEPSGTTAADASGFGRDGTYTNTPVLGTAGLLTGDTDTSMGVNANAGHCASIASASWMNVSAFTIELLIYLTSATDTGQGDALASRYGPAGFQWLLWRNTAGKLAIQTKNSGGTTLNVADPATASLSTRYHVASTWDGSTLRLYVNGVSVGTPVAMTSIIASTVAMEVGRYSGTNGTTPGGRLDEFAFYDTALSGAQIAAHYAAA